MIKSQNALTSKIAVVSSLAIIAVKKCHKGIAFEQDMKDLRTDEDIKHFMKYYFLKLHVLHSIALIGGSIVIVYAFVDLVPHHDQDFRFGFHLIVSDYKFKNRNRIA